MDRFAEFLVHLRSTGGDAAWVRTLQRGYEEYVRWLNPDRPATIGERLNRMFGRDRSLYISVATFNRLVHRKAPKSQIMTAMRELGFRQETHYVCGVQLRMWIRGEWDNDIRAYQPTPEVPPCPVPPPPY